MHLLKLNLCTFRKSVGRTCVLLLLPIWRPWRNKTHCYMLESHLRTCVNTSCTTNLVQSGQMVYHTRSNMAPGVCADPGRWQPQVDLDATSDHSEEPRYAPSTRPIHLHRSELLEIPCSQLAVSDGMFNMSSTPASAPVTHSMVT